MGSRPAVTSGASQYSQSPLIHSLPPGPPHLELAAPVDIAGHAVCGVVGLEQGQHAPDAFLHPLSVCLHPEPCPYRRRAGGLELATATRLHQAQPAGAGGGGQAGVGAQRGDLYRGEEVGRGFGLESCYSSRRGGRTATAAAAAAATALTWIPSCPAAERMLLPSGTLIACPLMVQLTILCWAA